MNLYTIVFVTYTYGPFQTFWWNSQWLLRLSNDNSKPWEWLDQWHPCFILKMAKKQSWRVKVRVVYDFIYINWLLLHFWAYLMQSPSMVIQKYPDFMICLTIFCRLPWIPKILSCTSFKNFWRQWHLYISKVFDHGVSYIKSHHQG